MWSQYFVRRLLSKNVVLGTGTINVELAQYFIKAGSSFPSSENSTPSFKREEPHSYHILVI